MIWKDLVKSANLGTDRVNPDFNLGNDNLSEILKNLESKSNEDKLLNYSSIVSIYQDAGTLPEILSEKIVLEKPLLDKRKITTFSEQFINQIFEESSEYSNYNKLQEDFFIELVKKNEILPENMILKFLEIGSKNRNLNYYIGLTLSKLSLFVSIKNTKWDYIYDIDENLEDIWEKSNKKIKLNISKKLLKTDSSLLIKILTESWNKLKKDEKEDLLELLNLDENKNLYKNVFEIALKDKHKTIEERAENIIKSINKQYKDYDNVLPEIYILFDKYFKIIESKNASSIKIKVDIPDNFDKKIVDEVNNGKVIGNNQTSFFAELISIIPLKYWEKRFNSKPQEIIDTFIKSNISGYLYHISIRAIREKNNDWLEALYNSNINYDMFIKHFTSDFKDKKLKNIFDNLPEEDINNISKMSLDKNNFSKLSEKEQNLYKSYTYSINTYLSNLSKVIALYDKLSLEQTKELFDKLIFILKSGDFNYYNLNDIANIVDVKIYPYIKEKIQESGIDRPEHKYFFRDIFNVIELRYKMLEEFNKNG